MFVKKIIIFEMIFSSIIMKHTSPAQITASRITIYRPRPGGKQPGSDSESERSENCRKRDPEDKVRYCIRRYRLYGLLPAHTLRTDPYFPLLHYSPCHIS